MSNRFFNYLSWGFLAIAITSCACTDVHKPEIDESKQADKNQEVAALTGSASPSQEVQQAIARIYPLKDNQIRGIVVFTKVPDGIRIVADVDGLTPGEHGFHIHEFGECKGDGASAGAHFNPTKKPHGGPTNPERHAGDMGNLVADENGHAHYERVDQVIAFEGTNSILGRSVIVHADRDDYVTQPTGASGAKIGCGIIEATKPWQENTRR